MKINSKTILIGSLILFSLWGGSGIIIFNVFNSNDRGTFGDMFGAINALFSGFALFGIIISIMIQQSELNLQRKELTDTREEFKINRLTNILFKQIEYLNMRLEDVKFNNEDINNPNHKNLSIDQFVLLLNDLFSTGIDERQELIKLFIELNEVNIASVITKVYSTLASFDNLLDDSGLKEKEKEQMRRMLKKNINPFFFSLLTYKISNMKKPSSDDEELFQIKETLLKIEFERIKYINNYGKDNT